MHQGFSLETKNRPGLRSALARRSGHGQFKLIRAERTMVQEVRQRRSIANHDSVKFPLESYISIGVGDTRCPGMIASEGDLLGAEDGYRDRRWRIDNR